MMGQHARSEALFYYFRRDDQVPENHLLRLIDKHISFEFVREQLKDSYRESGRPSIDPERLLRILLLGDLYGITSERKLVEELGMPLAWRWFPGLGFDPEVPQPSTFSKNRHGRFQESKLFEQLFERCYFMHAGGPSYRAAKGGVAWRQRLTPDDGHPEASRFRQRGEGSRARRWFAAGLESPCRRGAKCRFLARLRRASAAPGGSE
jgi:transposase